MKTDSAMSRPAQTQTQSEQDQPSASDKRLLQRVVRLHNKEQQLRGQSPTDAQLARVWPAWHALPPDTLPEIRCHILTGLNPQKDPAQAGHLQALQKRFPELHLPFPLDYHLTLQAAACWARLIEFHRTTVSLHKTLIENQWAFHQADDQADGRIAIHRAGQEFALLAPRLLTLKEPSLADLALLKDRYTAYGQARAEALEALANLLYKVPDMRTGIPLPVEERAVGLPHPPVDVPRHLYIARLDALGLCSQRRLASFGAQDFPKLDRAKRQAFYRMGRVARYGKDPYAALRVWLLDNRPVLEHEEFPWQWADIQAAAAEWGIEHPQTGLRQWAFNNELGLCLKSGPSPSNNTKVVQAQSLLSPAPVFGDVLKPSDR